MGSLKKAQKPRKSQIDSGEKKKKSVFIVEWYIGARAFVKLSADFFHSSQSS